MKVQDNMIEDRTENGGMEKGMGGDTIRQWREKEKENGSEAGNTETTNNERTIQQKIKKEPRTKTREI